MSHGAGCGAVSNTRSSRRCTCSTDAVPERHSVRKRYYRKIEDSFPVRNSCCSHRVFIRLLSRRGRPTGLLDQTQLVRHGGEDREANERVAADSGQNRGMGKTQEILESPLTSVPICRRVECSFRFQLPGDSFPQFVFRSTTAGIGSACTTQEYDPWLRVQGAVLPTNFRIVSPDRHDKATPVTGWKRYSEIRHSEHRRPHPSCRMGGRYWCLTGRAGDQIAKPLSDSHSS